MPQVWFLLRPLSLVCRQLLSHCVLMWPFFCREHVAKFPLLQGHWSDWVRAYPQALILTWSALQGLISKYSHLVTYFNRWLSGKPSSLQNTPKAMHSEVITVSQSFLLSVWHRSKESSPFPLHELRWTIYNGWPSTILLHACCEPSRSIVSASLWPFGQWSARCLSPWDSPGKDTGMSCHTLL